MNRKITGEKYQKNCHQVHPMMQPLLPEEEGIFYDDNACIYAEGLVLSRFCDDEDEMQDL